VLQGLEHELIDEDADRLYLAAEGALQRHPRNLTSEGGNLVDLVAADCVQADPRVVMEDEPRDSALRLDHRVSRSRLNHHNRKQS
jgi:hypothetical protein